ncbi:hypothetical protein LCGC14_1571460 [marine sediment metagenome]|uniref:Uncharacterized protein n=1 Tax=marine sediment metagenome TaxID=412755 RepID=A0A0F9IJP9_9ZZZZ
MDKRKSEAELAAVVCEWERVDGIIQRYNGLVEEQDRIKKQLHELDDELAERGPVLACAVQCACASEDPEVRDCVADLNCGIEKAHPEWFKAAELEDTADEPTVNLRPAAKQAVRRPDGTEVRRPSRPKRPKEIR